MLPAMHARLRAWVAQCDVIHLRVPTPAGYFGYRIAQRLKKPTFLLVVGDYRALTPHLPYRGVKKVLFGAYVAFEEWALGRMVRNTLTFTNGAALRQKHETQGARVHETKTSTLRLEDVTMRADTCGSEPIRLFTVSRIDPRKGLTLLPRVVAHLVSRGHEVTLDLVGPTIGQIGEAERAAIGRHADALGVTARVRLLGAVPLEELMPLYRQYDIFVLPTGPGEGIPRVLLEAMAAGLPVVTTRVAGISSLIADGDNGLLVSDPTPDQVGEAIRALILSPALRQRLIQRGYETARAHTVEHQAAAMMQIVGGELRTVVEAAGSGACGVSGDGTPTYLLRAAVARRRRRRASGRPHRQFARCLGLGPLDVFVQARRAISAGPGSGRRASRRDARLTPRPVARAQTFSSRPAS